MTVQGGMPAVRTSWLRWVGANIWIGLGRLFRPVRFGTRPVWRAYARVAAGALGSIVLLLLVMAFVDVPVIELARQTPGWLRRVFQVITRLGLSGWFLIPLGLTLILTALVTSPALPWTSRGVLAASAARQGFLFLAIFVPGVITNVLKYLLSRARPRWAGDDPFAFKFFDGVRHFFDGNPQFASMPSGHATTAFAVAVAFGFLWPRLRPLLWTYAILIGLSRIVITAHHPSDVLAGAIVGCVGALLVRDRFAARGLGFAIRPDGSVATMPGPSFARIKRVARQVTGK